MPLISPATLHQAAPQLDFALARRASESLSCAGTRPRRLLVADMDLPSSTRRLFVFDVSDPARPALISRQFVAHGYGSDPGKTGHARRFSNTPDSGMTSLGLYRVAEPYLGAHGKSWRMDGLTPGWNDKARQRAVTLHPATYVGDGHVGTSAGCLALNPKALAKMARTGGFQDTYVWVDAPSQATNLDPDLCGMPKALHARPWVAVSSALRGWTSGVQWGNSRKDAVL